MIAMAGSQNSWLNPNNLTDTEHLQELGWASSPLTLIATSWWIIPSTFEYILNKERKYSLSMAWAFFFYSVTIIFQMIALIKPWAPCCLFPTFSMFSWILGHVCYRRVTGQPVKPVNLADTDNLQELGWASSPLNSIRTSWRIIPSTFE